MIRADVSSDVLDAFQTSKMVSKDHFQAILVEVIPWCKQIIPSLYLGLKKHRNKQGAKKIRNQQTFMSALRDTFLSRKSSSERMISKAPKASTKSDLSRSASDGAYAIYVPWGL